MPSISLFTFEGEDLTGIIPVLANLKDILFSGQSSPIDISQKLTQLEARLMATFTEVLTAIEGNGLAIADVASTITTQAASIRALLEGLQNGQQPSEAELQAALSTLESQNTSLLGIKDAALQLIPTIPSPEVPSTPDEPTPEPSPEPSTPVTPDDVVITPNDGVGLDGSVSIDLPPAV
jgi:hypothetical protein